MTAVGTNSNSKNKTNKFVVCLEDPEHLGLDIIKTIAEEIVMDDYTGSPTKESITFVSNWYQLEYAFVEEVYWVLLGGLPSGGLSTRVNDMILKDYKCIRLQIKDLELIDRSNTSNHCNGNHADVLLAIKFDVSVHFIQCVRDAIQQGNGESEYLSCSTIQLIKNYIAQKEEAKADRCKKFHSNSYTYDGPTLQQPYHPPRGGSRVPTAKGEEKLSSSGETVLHLNYLALSLVVVTVTALFGIFTPLLLIVLPPSMDETTTRN